MRFFRVAACALVTGLTLFLMGTVFHFGIQIAAPNIPPQFKNVALYRPWEGWTSTYMLIHPFGFGILFAGLYLLLVARNCLRHGWRTGLSYGTAVFMVGSFPVYMLAFASFQMSPEIAVAWIIQSACQYTVAGAILGWLANRLEPRA